MKFGVCVPNYGETCSTEALRNVAAEAERSGFDSVWCTDHILIPRDSGTPYERIYESITSIAYLAGVTSKVKLGISSLITDRKSTRLNSSHGYISYAVFCLKKKTNKAKLDSLRS